MIRLRYRLQPNPASMAATTATHSRHFLHHSARKTRYAAAALLLALGAGCATNQPAGAHKTSPSEAEQAVLMQRLNTYSQAVLAGDFNTEATLTYPTFFNRTYNIPKGSQFSVDDYIKKQTQNRERHKRAGFQGDWRLGQVGDCYTTASRQVCFVPVEKISRYTTGQNSSTEYIVAVKDSTGGAPWYFLDIASALPDDLDLLYRLIPDMPFGMTLPPIWEGEAGGGNRNAIPCSPAGQRPTSSACADNKNIDAALPVFSTGISTVISPVISMAGHTGTMAWLDGNTLAITPDATYQDGDESSKRSDHWKNRIVAVDVGARAVSTIMEYGFLNCTNPHEGVVAIFKGDLAKQYGPSKATSDPGKVFYAWDSASKTLKNEEKEPKTPWNWFICAQTTNNDMKLPVYAIASKGIRYLLPGDGALGWSSDRLPKTEKPVVLWRPNKPLPQPLDITAADVNENDTPYFSFNESYLLTGGEFRVGGAKINYRGKEVDQTPAVTMTRSGTISRTYIPKSIKAYLDDLKPDPQNRFAGNTIPTAVGPLVYVNETSEKGGGLYLESRGKANRIWCTAEQAVKDCAIEQMKLSPDGCALAFMPQKGYDKSVHILRLCQNK